MVFARCGQNPENKAVSLDLCASVQPIDKGIRFTMLHESLYVDWTYETEAQRDEVLENFYARNGRFYG